MCVWLNFRVNPMVMAFAIILALISIICSPHQRAAQRSAALDATPSQAPSPSSKGKTAPESTKTQANNTGADGDSPDFPRGVLDDYEISKLRRVGDFSRVASLLKPYEQKGDAKAAYELGMIFYQGHENVGIRRDYGKALDYLQEAQAKHHVEANDVLGEMYSLGRGVEQDQVKATDFFLFAAEHDNAGAQNSMGIRLVKGAGTVADAASASVWFRRSAENNYKRGQLNLGIQLRNGQGQEADEVEALKWFQIAATKWWPGVYEDDMASAKMYVSALSSELTPAQITKANQMAAAWKPAWSMDNDIRNRARAKQLIGTWSTWNHSAGEVVPTFSLRADGSWEGERGIAGDEIQMDGHALVNARGLWRLIDGAVYFVVDTCESKAPVPRGLTFMEEIISVTGKSFEFTNSAGQRRKAQRVRR